MVSMVNLGGHKMEAYRIHNKKTNMVLPICSIL